MIVSIFPQLLSFAHGEESFVVCVCVSSGGEVGCVCAEPLPDW
jgi:hypothetical protein